MRIHAACAAVPQASNATVIQQDLKGSMAHLAGLPEGSSQP
jgi:hypothetical protein